MSVFESIRETVRESFAEFSNVQTITVCGIFAAMGVALKFVASIDIGPYIRIGISDIPGIIISAMYGPAIGGIFWGVLDIVKYLVAPNGPFFPGFTVSAVLNGILFGFLLYRKQLTIPRVLMAEFLSKLIVSLGLNTIWLSMLYGTAISVMLPARILTNVIMLPIDTAITFACVQVYNQMRFRLNRST